jgi:hypothetical protein
MAINMGGGIGSFGAAVRDRTDTFSMNPQAMQGAQQEVQRATKSGIAPDMIDLISLQAALAAKEDAKKAVEASLDQQPKTIAAQRAEALQAATKDELVGQVGATLNQRNRQAAQKMAQLQKQLGAPPAGGIAQQPAPNMARMAGGGIVGYQAGGSAGAGMLGKSEKATAVLNSIGVTPEQYQAMPPEGQQQVLQTIKARRSNMPAAPMQQPAPNMARMAGGGIVAFQEGGATDGLAKVRQVQERVDIFRRLGLDPAVVASLSPEGRAAIMDLADRAATASTRDLEQTFPNQISKILQKEANVQQQQADSVLNRSATDASYRDVNLPRAERTALIEDAKKTAANARTLSGVSKDVRGAVPFGITTPTGTYGLFGAGGISPMADDIFPPTSPPAQPAAPLGPSPQMAGIVGTPPAAQRPPDLALSPQQAAQGVLGAEIAVPELTAPPLPGTKLASGIVSADRKAELAGRLGGIDAVNRELRNASGIDTARERAKFVDEAMRRKQNRELLEGSRSDRQALLAQQAEQRELRNRSNPLGELAARMSAGVGGIGGLGRLNLADQNKFRTDSAASRADLDKEYAMRQNEVKYDTEAGKVAAEAGAQGFADVATGIRQASANMTSLYRTETDAAAAEAKNLLTKSMAELTAEQQSIKQAFDFQSAIFTDASRRRTAQIAGAATIAAAQIKTMSDDKKQRVEAAKAMADFRKDLEETYRKVRLDIESRPDLEPEQREALLKEAQDGFAKSIAATKNLFAEALADGQPLLSVNPVTQ